MSVKGVALFASVLNVAQQTRYELIKMGSESSPADQEDIRLGHLLDEMKDSIKDKFCEIMLEEKKP